MSRAFPLPGAAARSPQSIEMDPHFTKLQPWRPRAGGTAPGERQGCKTSSNLSSNSTPTRRRPGPPVRGRPDGWRMRSERLVVELALVRH